VIDLDFTPRKRSWVGW